MVTITLTLDEAQDLLWQLQFDTDTWEGEVENGVFSKALQDNLLSVKAKLEAAEDV